MRLEQDHREAPGGGIQGDAQPGGAATDDREVIPMGLRQSLQQLRALHAGIVTQLQR
jgi:hypothetical protein